MSWGRHHIACAQNGGEFLKQMLHVCSHRIRNWQNEMGSVASKTEKGGSETCENWAKKMRQWAGPPLYKQREFCLSLEQQ
jgi:hypothetical protein